MSLEELFFKKIKNFDQNTKTLNKIKFAEFRDLSFEGFWLSSKFSPEKRFFQSFIKKLSKKVFFIKILLVLSDKQENKKCLYLYNRNYTVKSHQIIEDDDLSQEKSEELSNLIILPYDTKLKGSTFINSSYNKFNSTFSSKGNSKEIENLTNQNDSIMIHKSEMRFFSELNKTKIQCLKDHKNSICTNNSNNNKEIIEERPYLPENDDLISNFSDEDIESKSNNSIGFEMDSI